MVSFNNCKKTPKPISVNFSSDQYTEFIRVVVSFNNLKKKKPAEAH